MTTKNPTALTAIVLIVLMLLQLSVVDADGQRKTPNPNPTPSTAKPANTGRVGDVIKNSIGMEFVFIPAGKFLMGSPRGEGFDSEKPQRTVTIQEDFWLGRYEVTQGQYETVTGANPTAFKGCGKDCPVDNVSWNHAKEFVKRLNNRNDGFTYSLPTEAEWEYSARAGTITPFASGASLSSTQANFDGTKPYGGASTGPNLKATTRVGSYPPNAWGLHDMHGNVAEWVEDIYLGDGYGGLPADGSANTTKRRRFSSDEYDLIALGYAVTRVLRGGAWVFSGETARSAARNSGMPTAGQDWSGFRIAARPRTIESKRAQSNSIGMEFVHIPAGRFLMGSPSTELGRGSDEGPQRFVTFRDAFWMGRYEVTQGQYGEVLGRDPSHFSGCGKDCPVENVSWDEAKEFIRRLNAENDGFIYSLPTEAEWEYAARAGTNTVFAFGDTLGLGQANFGGRFEQSDASSGTYLNNTVRVGSYLPNAWGLYDMHGNVEEWVEDFHALSYEGLPIDGSPNSRVGHQAVRVTRGGAWGFFGFAVRSASRGAGDPTKGSWKGGFRVVRRLKK